MTKPTRLCSITGCTKPHMARGWCQMHWCRWRRHGTPHTTLATRSDGTCQADNCTQKHVARGYCTKHYQRLTATGSPDCKPSRDIDEIAVDRAVAGERAGDLNLGEREAAVRRLHREGLTDGRIAVRVGLKRTGVKSIRERLGLPGNARGAAAVEWLDTEAVTAR